MDAGSSAEVEKKLDLILSLKAFLASSLSALGVTFGRLISQNGPFFGSTSIIETMLHLEDTDREEDEDGHKKTLATDTP